MILINDRFFLLFKSLLLSLLIMGLMVFDGNIERVFIVAATLMIISVIRNFKLKINYTFLIFIGLIIGYILGNFLLYYSADINNNSIGRNDGDDERLKKPAVIIFMDGEPGAFDLSSALNNIYNDDSIIRKINAPIEVFQSKVAYENVGSSKNTELCNRIRDDLKLRLGMDYDVYIAYFNTEPLVYEEINRLGEKYEKLILVPLMLSESEKYKELVKTIEDYSLNGNVEMKITPFLWRSKKLSKELLKKTIEKTGKDNIDDTGVILLMSEKHNFYEQGIFCNEVIRRMEESGFEKDNVICLKYDGKEKLLKNSIRLLSGRGVDNVMIISVSGLQDEIKEQSDLINQAKKATKKEYVNVIYINGWGISENLLNELELKIRMANIKD